MQQHGHAQPSRTVEDGREHRIVEVARADPAAQHRALEAERADAAFEFEGCFIGHRYRQRRQRLESV